MSLARSPAKPKTCKCGCKQKFIPRSSFQPTTDDFECKVRYAEKVAAKSKSAREKADRKATQAAKEKLKTRRDYMKEAQIAFNTFIRARDEGKPCISCGTPLVRDVCGGGYDSGHFRSRGAAMHLAFDERNAHGQCKRCNRYLSGNVSNYRIGLIERIGFDQVANLESCNDPKHYTIEDLKRIRDEYREKVKALRKKMPDATGFLLRID